MNPSEPGAFSFGRQLMGDLISLISVDIGLLKLSIRITF
jgi:hypothetical protein